MLTFLRRRLAAPASASTSVPLDTPRARARSIPHPRPELLGLLALAALLNLWALSRNGWANEYYSAAVRSMTTSWHNFLFGAFDQAGVMTVDKPPLALWVQAASATSLSMLVPQALMGVAAVALVYDLTRRVFERPAGFVAGLVLALTPIAVAISRHNNPDALLVLCGVAALWCVVRGLADGRTRWMVLAGVAIGLGFETKMAAALIVVPALAAAWLWAAPGDGFARPLERHRTPTRLLRQQHPLPPQPRRQPPSQRCPASHCPHPSPSLAPRTRLPHQTHQTRQHQDRSAPTPQTPTLRRRLPHPSSQTNTPPNPNETSTPTLT